MPGDNNFPDKYMKKIADIPDFIDSINAADTEDVKKKLLEAEGHIFEIEKSVENDAELQDAKEKAKEFAKPYRESKGIETAKIKYCLYILESRGVNL